MRLKAKLNVYILVQTFQRFAFYSAAPEKQDIFFLMLIKLFYDFVKKNLISFENKTAEIHFDSAINFFFHFCNI